MPSPRVLHVSEALGGGVLGVVSALANDSASRGIETMVIHGRRPQTPVETRSHFHRDVSVIEIPGWGARKGIRDFGAHARAAHAIRASAAAPETVVHLHSTVAGMVGRMALLGRRRTILYSPHAYAFLNPSARFVARLAAFAMEFCAARIGTTVAVSEAEAKIAARVVRSPRVVVVPNGVEVVDQARLDEVGGSLPVVAAVGRAWPQRCPADFALTVGLLRERGPAGLHYVWIGDGPESHALHAESIEVTGWISHDEVIERLGAASIVVHLSAYEGLPLALLEAMSLGKCVVASDIPVIREVVGPAGVLVDGPLAAAGEINSLMLDAAERNRLGELARSRVTERFSRAAMLERARRLYAA